jgi:predicted nuclease with TOPRIM domain
MNSEIEKLKLELDQVKEELYELKFSKSKSHLENSHFELILDIESALNDKIKELKPKEFDDITVEEFLTFVKTIKEFITEYKKSYRLC